MSQGPKPKRLARLERFPGAHGPLPAVAGAHRGKAGFRKQHGLCGGGGHIEHSKSQDSRNFGTLQVTFRLYDNLSLLGVDYYNAASGPLWNIHGLSLQKVF